MARFRGTVQGTRGPTSRLGHRTVHTECNGWGSGIDVSAFIDEKDRDVFEVRMTGGSKGPSPDNGLIGFFVMIDGKMVDWVTLED